jgi:hypothetical protein
LWGCKVHVRTFDKTYFPKSTVGDYWLATTTSADAFSAQVRVNSKSDNKGLSVAGVALKYQNDIIVIDTDFYSKSDSTLYINGVLQLTDTVNLATGLYIKKTYYRNGEHTYSLLRQGSFLLRVNGDPKHQETTLKLSISGIYSNTTSGICGNFDNVDDGSAFTPLTSGSYFTTGRPVQAPVTSYSCTLVPGTLASEADTICLNTSIIDSNLQVTSHKHHL